MVLLALLVVLSIGTPDSAEGAEPFTIIDVSGDTELDQLFSNNPAWTGSGTEADPYMIQNLDINAAGSDFAISIAHTSKHLVIKDCIVRDSNLYGVYLQDDSNVIVRNNVCILNSVGNHYGIFVTECRDLVIYDNDCTNIGVGIYLQYTNNTIIQFNNCSGGESGIYLSESSHNQLLNNYCNDTMYGIGLQSECNFNTVDSNICIRTQYQGIYLTYSHNSTLSNNICDGHGDDFYLEGTYNSTVHLNTCGDQIKGASGITVFDSNDNIFSDNDCSNNNNGISFGNSNNNTIYANTCLNNDGEGITIDSSMNNTITDNICSNNWVAGIALHSSSANSTGNRIIGNICTNNGIDTFYGGVLVQSSPSNPSTGNTISHNFCDGNYYGIYLLNSPNNNISSNTVINNIGSGIIIESSWGNIASSNTIANNRESGVYLKGSDKCVIRGNTVPSNYDGIYLESSDDNSLFRNNVPGNDYGIIMYGSAGNSMDENNCSAGGLGIYIMSNCNNNLVANNTIWGNSQDGIYIQGPCRNTIFNNTCASNRNGIVLEGVESSPIANNTCFRNTDTGMYLYSSSHNTISGNSIYENQYGLTINGFSTGNEVFGNGFFDNTYTGVYLLSCDGNRVYGNILSGNQGSGQVYGTPQASDSGVNWWNTTTYGNLWLDWTGPDADSDGIVDSPYILTGLGGQDNYPLSIALEITSTANGSYVGDPTLGLQGTAICQLDSTLTWRNDATGRSGACTGMQPWSAAIPLNEGENEIKVTLNVISKYEVNATIMVILDSSSPLLEISSPANDSFSGSSVTMTWTSSDDGSGVSHIEISANGTVWTMVSGSQHTFADLGQGRHTLWVRAYDRTGNCVTRTVDVIVDTVPPSVGIISPGEGYLDSTGDVTISWTGSDATSGVDHFSVSWEGGSPVILPASADSYTFAGLGDGSHLLTVTVHDRKGLTSSDTVTVIVDTQPPSIAITSPAQGGYVNDADVMVSWSGADSGTGISYYVTSIEDMASFNTTGTSCIFSNLADGTYTVMVSAYDQLGNYRDVTVTFTVDTLAPTLVIISPVEGRSFNETSLTVSWTTSDVNPGTAHVRFDGGAWEAAYDQHYIRTALTEGHHNVDIKVTDAAGNARMASVNFTVDTIAPTVSFVYPNDGSLVNSSIGIVEWSTDGASSSIRMDGGEWTDVGQNSSWAYSLEDGEHTIEVKVTDHAGNSAQAALVIAVDTTAPTAEYYPLGEGLGLDQVILVEFSEAMNQTSVEISITDVSGIMAWEGNAVTFTPSVLQYGREYAVNVSGMDLAGNAIHLNWTFRTTVGTGSLTGVLVDQDGDPIANVTVRVGDRTAMTDELGRFVLNDLAPGNYVLTVDEEGYEMYSGIVTLVPGETEELGELTLVTEGAGEEDDGGSLPIYAIVAIVALLAVAIAVVFLRKKK